ncbi:hypothetical protein [Aeribacillus alveayuensis]|uniref:Uncharacterized protein n=1 Tax=Aeribacillus alveayuensis TaxID=279215 RepID=A0ABT9VSU0_9BACI|nr:hypothetical protein [Bacillus alveayuensis]
MSNYRKKLFRGAKIEDCILDFIEMEKELRRAIETNKGNEKLLLSGMSHAYRMIVNRLVREFDYSKGGVIVNTKLTDLIQSLEKRVKESKEQSKRSGTNLVNNVYYDDIPNEAKNEIENIPREFQKGLFDGMSVVYEKIVIDLDIILKSDDSDKIICIERLLESYQRVVEKLKEKFRKDDVDYRSGYLQGEVSAYQMVGEEIKVIFDLTEK